MSNLDTYHKSVLVKEVLYYLAPQPDKIYVDVTFGGGGHTKAILESEPNCKVIATDWDKRAIEVNGPALQEKYGDRLTLLWGSFSHLKYLLKKINVNKVDGILADFGTSQFQINYSPGFSFNIDSPLDMRMSTGHHQLTASEIVSRASEQELAKIFWEYGDEPESRKFARAIVRYRSNHGPIRTTRQLAQIIENIIGPAYKKKKIHPATRVFQALRIVINDELNNIKSLLNQSLELLNPEGRLLCISFHSLEDQLVKDFFRNHSHAFSLLTKKVVTPTEEEVNENPSSRSSKLRAGIKNL